MIISTSPLKLTFDDRLGEATGVVCTDDADESLVKESLRIVNDENIELIFLDILLDLLG